MTPSNRTRPRYVAHTNSGKSKSDWEPLINHLRLVADGGPTGRFGSRRFADVFGASDWGYIAGLWHDVGKYSDAFQRYLDQSAAGDSVTRGTIDHSTAGAQLAMKAFGSPGYPLAYVIAGHHAGLADYKNGLSGIEDRLKKLAPEIDDALKKMPDCVKNQTAPPVPDLLKTLSPSDHCPDLRIAFFVRMLFSCLVDADFLATEWYMSNSQSRLRPEKPIRIDSLLRSLNQYIERIAPPSPTGVNLYRARLLSDCRKQALHKQGLFSLTAPTGVGKTLSSLAFALEHAKKHNLRRIVYALPFTSVTEQVAQVFQSVFQDLGENVVLEHHSSASWKSSEDGDLQGFRVRLAAENWDASVVVTTNVQLLESLFANRSSRCRKLHRLAKSVIVFDEAQVLPVPLMEPTLVAIDELKRGYGASVVLCSATMPALKKRHGFEIGLKDVREIVPDPQSLAQVMRRADLHRLGDIDDEDLIDQICDNEQALAVLNTKSHAAELYAGITNRIGSDGVWHLSAAMCSAHRSMTVSSIKSALDRGKPCIVISTQVIEAGVDVDFPVVYRAMAGLDSIVQAAGRCNRNGKMVSGHVFLFDTENAGQLIQQQGDVTKEVASIYKDLLSLEAIEHYFKLHLWKRKSEWDKHGIAKKGMFDAKGFVFNFKEAADKYRVIDQDTEPIVVPFGDDGLKLIEEMQEVEYPSRSLLRKSQRFTVPVPRNQHKELVERGTCIIFHDHTTVLIDHSLYDPNLGLVIDRESGLPEQLIG